MLMDLKHLAQAARPAVVEEAAALADAEEGRRVEVAQAALVVEADVERVERRVVRRAVAAAAPVACEHLPAAGDGFGVDRASGGVDARRGRQGAEERGD